MPLRLRFLLLLIIALTLLACQSEGYEIVRGATESGPPEEIVIAETVEKVYNCGLGGDTVYLSHYQSLATAEAVQWEWGAEAEAELVQPVRLVELGGELQMKYGKGYEKSAEIGAAWQLPARPGEWLEYTIRWSEVWHQGDVIQKIGNRQETVNYRYRKAIKTEIVGKNLLDCGPVATVAVPAEEVITETSTPSAEATPTPSPVAPQPSSITSEYRVVVHGFGLAPADMTNPGQRRRAATLAAEMDAKRKLAEWLSGADLEAVTVVDGGQVDSDVIRQEVRTHLIGTQIINESYDEASGEAMVEMGLILEAGGS